MSELHQYRCETCANNKTSEHSEEIVPGFVGKKSRYIDFGSVWCDIPNQYKEHWIEPYPFEERGCASHSFLKAQLKAIRDNCKGTIECPLEMNAKNLAKDTIYCLDLKPSKQERS